MDITTDPAPPPSQALAPASTDTTTSLMLVADSLISAWKCEETVLDDNRKLRKLDYTAEELQARKIIDPSETFIGFRVIDENILREIPIFLRYVAGSARQLVFRPLEPSEDLPVDILETTFTAYVRYEMWQVPLYEAFDSAALNGRGIIEVIADQTKACGLSSEFIEAKNFLFPLKARSNIQRSPMLARLYEWNAEEFRNNAQLLKLDKAVVDEVLANNNEKALITETYKVYKLFFRKEGIVMCAWYTDKNKNKLLREPYQHDGGKFDANGMSIPMSDYPFFMLRYRITEETTISTTMGRGKLDKFNQEGQCRLGTSLVNGVARACNIYPSVEGGLSEGNQLEAEVSIVPNKIMKRQIKFNEIPYPDGIVLNAIGMLAGRNSQSTGQVDYTAKNRQDSRKTAAEIDAAQQQAAELSGISIFALAQFCLQVYAYYWSVIQSNAVMNPRSKFLTSAGEKRTALLLADYNLLPAGDIDYVERQKKIQAMLQYWPIVANTPAAMPYLKKLLTLALPDESADIIAALDASTGDARISMAQGLVEILAGMNREALLALFPDQATKQQFNQILDETINTFRSQSQDGAQAGPQQQPAVPSNGQANQGQPRGGAQQVPPPQQGGKA